MTGKKLNSSFLSNPEIKKIFEALNNQARFVGGCVRDSLLDKTIKDIDIATVFTPEEAMKKLFEAGIKTIATGLKHGSITAILKNKETVDITTLRRDVECNGRHAKIEFTKSWEEDALRRDFTINALSCDLEGNIYDYYEGLKDLDKGLIRFVGDASQRCSEDILRILRFFRFFTYYGKEPINQEAILACREFAPYIKNLSGERIMSEMTKIFLAKNPLKSLKLMEEHNILKHTVSTDINLSFLEKIILTEQENLIENISVILRISSVLRTSDKKEELALNLCNRWKASNKFKNELLFLVKNDTIAKNLSVKEYRILIYKYGKRNFINLLYLNISETEEAKEIKDNLTIYKDLVSLCLSTEIPELPVSAQDFIDLGFRDKEIGDKIKEAIKHWTEHDFQISKKELIELTKA